MVQSQILQSQIVRSPLKNTEWMTVDVVVVRDDAGAADLIPAGSDSCHSCGLCHRVSGTTGPADAPKLSLALPVHSLLGVALGLYGVPLAGLLAGALAATALGVGDVGALVGSLLGCATAVAVMRRYTGDLEERTTERLEYRKFQGKPQSPGRP